MTRRLSKRRKPQIERLTSVMAAAAFALAPMPWPISLFWHDVSAGCSFSVADSSREYLLWPHMRKQLTAKKARVEDLMNMMHIEEFADSYPGQLSGGMKKRVALARALANEPELLLLDEPLGALDAFTRMHIQDELLDIKNAQKTSVLMITHDIDEAVYLSDYMVVMTPRPGRVTQIIEIRMDHPRNRSDEKIVNRRNEILEILHYAKSK